LIVKEKHVLKKILKNIFVFLTFVILVTVVVSAGCSAGSAKATTPSTGQSATTGQTAPGQADQQGRTPRNPDFMKSILAKVADKLGVSADSVTQAYTAAQASVTPPAPPQQSGQGNTPPTPPGQGSGRTPGADRTAYNAALYDKMATSLNIPADKISVAFQSAMTELRPANGTRGGGTPGTSAQ
jgi:hypothetical protein